MNTPTDDQVRVALDTVDRALQKLRSIAWPDSMDLENARETLAKSTAFLASLGGEPVAWQCRERFWDGAPWGHWRTFNHRSERDDHAAMLREDNWLTESRDLYTSAIAAHMAGGGITVEWVLGYVSDSASAQEVRDAFAEWKGLTPSPARGGVDLPPKKLVFKEPGLRDGEFERQCDYAAGWNACLALIDQQGDSHGR